MNITIGGKDYSKHLAHPVTIQRTLNEQLDTAMLNLMFTRAKTPFQPFTSAVFEEDGVRTEFVVAIDNVKEIFGRELYNHEITLIEETKLTERILCEAKAFTQPIVKDYNGGQSPAPYTIYYYDGGTVTAAGSGTLPADTLQTPVAASSTIEIPFNGRMLAAGVYSVLRDSVTIYKAYGKIQILDGSDVVAEYPTALLDLTKSIQNVLVPNNGLTVRIYTGETGAESDQRGYYYDITLEVVSQADKRDPYTVYDVVDVLLDVSEPLRKRLDTRRFDIDADPIVMKKLRETKAPPQLLFSNGRSLWENLREVGRIVHAMPSIRTTPIGTRCVYFSELGGSEYADLSKGRPYGFTDAFNASDYTAAIEANANNLMNAESERNGAITEPFANGFRSLRTSRENTRIKDETGEIETAYAIEKVTELTAAFKTKAGELKTIDLTPFVFEKSEYDLLSSYSGTYPNSKTYAIYYAQGSNNVRGLWFKASDSGSEMLDAFERPAIVNILASAASINASDISDNYADIAFRLSYITTVSARVRQHRTTYSGIDELVMAYNQSANKLDSRAFGEALRGQVAMMGTTSSSVSYMFKRFSDIPEPGLLYDNENYISVVTTRVFKDFCLCQIDLSTGFNELGAYAEMNNAFRRFEIPGAEERFTVIEEFCDVSYEDTPSAEGIAVTDAFKGFFVDAFDGYGDHKITLAEVSTYDESEELIREGILLPVVSYAIGTALYFGFRFLDNYSAGMTSEFAPKSEAVYRLQQDVPYGDAFYSAAKLLNFSLYANPSMSASALPAAAHALPAASAGISKGEKLVTLGSYPLIWHKDTADSGNVSYQLHFVSSSGFIIGSGLANSCPFVRNKSDGLRARVYFFKRRINQLTGTADTSEAVAESDFRMQTVGRSVLFEVLNPPTTRFESWAVIRGSEFLFGKNDTEIEPHIYFNFKRKR